jgi:hypothetical protein
MEPPRLLFATRRDFSRDFGVEELFGINVFIRRGERIFRTYFLNGRGIEEIGPVWSFLDMTLLGRQENWQDVPPGLRVRPTHGGVFTTITDKSLLPTLRNRREALKFPPVS